MYIHGIYMFVHIKVLYILCYTLYSQYKYMYILISPESQQDFVVSTVIKNSVLSLHHLLPRRIRTRAVHAQKMEICFMVGQTQQRQRRPSASLCGFPQQGWCWGGCQRVCGPLPWHIHWWQGGGQDDWRPHENADADYALVRDLIAPEVHVYT